MKSKSLLAGFAVLVAGLIFVTGGGAATSTTVTLTVNTTTDSATPCVVVNHKSSGTCSLRGAILCNLDHRQRGARGAGSVDPAALQASEARDVQLVQRALKGSVGARACTAASERGLRPRSGSRSSNADAFRSTRDALQQCCR